jgi:selT/selW/selH-like putative selenoprotein
LRELAGAEVELKRSRGGVFEITVDGTLRFSKKRLGRFPTDDEIAEIAKA